MPLRLVRAWRGLIRARLKRSLLHLNALVAYNTKYPADQLFTSAEIASIAAVQTILTAKIAATRVR